MTLQELQNKNKYNTDKGTSHTYLETYEELFRPYKDKEIKLVEVGIYGGGSLRLWEDYFTKALIMGVDITSFYMGDFKPRTDRVITHIQDIKEMQSEDFKGFSIAIDDGSHRLEDQLYFVKLMLPVVKGFIIVEDIQRQDYIQKFKELGECEVVDLRHQGHHDNVLIIYRT
jgi:hypothetical protein